jgi:hypothetical protein
MIDFPLLRNILAVVAVFAAVRAASAQQPQAPASETTQPQPFAAGLSLGVGNVSFHPTAQSAPAVEPYTGVGVTLWGAWRFADRFGISLDATIVDRRGGDITAGSLLLGGQYWIAPTVWLKGLAGWGVLNADDPARLPEDDDGAAFGAAAGVRMATFRRSGIDIDAQLRFTQSQVSDVRARTVAAQLGVSKRFGVSAFATSTSAPQAAPTRNNGRNLLGFDVLGRGGLVGIAYERELSTRIGIGVGGGLGWDIILESAPGFVPVSISWSPLGETHRLYTSGGIALVHVSENLRDYFVNFEPRIGWSAYSIGGVGYEHRLRDNDGFWRLVLNTWYQPSGIPGGLLDMQDSGFALVPSYSIVWRF